MPPRKEIWDERVSIWGQAELANADPPQPKEFNRTCKVILKTAVITSTIAAVIISISFITAFTFINSSSNQANDLPPLNVDQPYRSVFTHPSTPINQIGKYIAFSVLRETIADSGSMIKYLKPEFIDDIADERDLEQDYFNYNSLLLQNLMI